MRASKVIAVVAAGLVLCGLSTISHARHGHRSSFHTSIGFGHHWHGNHGWHGGFHHGWDDHIWLGFTYPFGFSYTYYDRPYERDYVRVYREEPRVNYRPRRLARNARLMAPPIPRRTDLEPKKSPEELMLEHARAKREAAAPKDIEKRESATKPTPAEATPTAPPIPER